MHVERGEELVCLILVEVSTQVISNVVILGADVLHDRVELVLHHEIQVLPQESRNLRILKLLVCAVKTDFSIIQIKFH